MSAGASTLSPALLPAVAVLLQPRVANSRSQTSKKYLAKASLVRGFPSILTRSVTSNKCGEVNKPADGRGVDEKMVESSEAKSTLLVSTEKLHGLLIALKITHLGWGRGWELAKILHSSHTTRAS